jgi:uncharacterized protein YegL
MSNQIVAINNTGLSLNEFQNTLKSVLATPVKSKPYTAQITRETPSAFVFLIDQSGSMKEKIDYRNEKISKAEAVTLIVNETLNDVLNRCQKDSEVRDYFEIALIGYGGKDREQANFAWEGALADKTFVKIAELATTFISQEIITIETNMRGRVIQTQKPIKKWISPLAQSLTPMRHALEMCGQLLEDWLIRYQHKDIFPPIVINITDGEATDGKEKELMQAANRIKNLHTVDGNVLLLNVHLSDAGNTPILFPTYAQELPDDEHAQLLFKMSSDMPSIFNNDIARLTGKDTAGAYSGMAFNADAKSLVSMMQIGTNTAMGKTQAG